MDHSGLQACRKGLGRGSRKGLGRVSEGVCVSEVSQRCLGGVSEELSHRSMASSLGLTSTRGMSVSMPAPKAYEYLSGGTFGYSVCVRMGPSSMSMLGGV